MTMKRMWSGALALLLALGLAACESPLETVEPQLEPTGQTEEALISYVTSGGYQVVQETDPEVGVVKAWIDSRGGVLALGEHALVVPAGAVSERTHFVMSKPYPSSLHFKLTATRTLLNDVGHRGFHKPVYLAISYKQAGISDPSKLKVVWARWIGGPEAQPTAVDYQNQWAVGELTHFSDYLLAMP